MSWDKLIDEFELGLLWLVASDLAGGILGVEISHIGDVKRISQSYGDHIFVRTLESTFRSFACMSEILKYVQQHIYEKFQHRKATLDKIVSSPTLGIRTGDVVQLVLKDTVIKSQTHAQIYEALWHVCHPAHATLQAAHEQLKNIQDGDEAHYKLSEFSLKEDAKTLLHYCTVLLQA